MGVEYYVIEGGSTELVVGGVANRVGKLRRIGKSTSQTASQIEGAAERWKGRKAPMPAAVFVPGSENGSEGAIRAWENGLGGTNDWDWERLPLLGSAHIGADGRLVLHAVDSPEPMSLPDAVEAGVASPDGKLVRRARPRIAEASATRIRGADRQNPSSTGPIEVWREKLAYRLDDGHEDDLLAVPELSEEAREAVNGGALVGMTPDEAYKWVQEHPRRDRRSEMAAVRVLGDGLIVIECGTQKVEMHPDRLRGGGFGIVVRGGGGGYPMEAEDAFLAAGDALKWGGTEVSSARTVGHGYLALEVGEGEETMGLLVVTVEDGGMGIMCGPAFPRELHRDTAMRHDAPMGGVEAAEALLRWPGERVAVPQGKVAPFLADLGLYLAECGAEALRAKAGGSRADLPMFQQFLDREGIDYGGALPGPMVR